MTSKRKTGKRIDLNNTLVNLKGNLAKFNTLVDEAYLSVSDTNELASYRSIAIRQDGTVRTAKEQKVFVEALEQEIVRLQRLLSQANQEADRLKKYRVLAMSLQEMAARVVERRISEDPLSALLAIDSEYRRIVREYKLT